MIPPRWVLRLLWAIHRGIDRLTGGRIGTVRPTGQRLGTLFVISTGRTSGQPRRNPVYYVEEGPNLVVVASNAGAPTDPAWWQNLAGTARRIRGDRRRATRRPRPSRDAGRAGQVVAGVRPWVGDVQRVPGEHGPETVGRDPRTALTGRIGAWRPRAA